MTYNFTFNLTNECNLNCEYCYQKNVIGENREDAKTPMRMSLETAMQITDKIEVDFITSGIRGKTLRSIASGGYQPISFSIVFTGGEPTLNFEVMEYFISFFEEFSKNKPFHIGTYYSMASNCTSINQLNELAKKYNIVIDVTPTIGKGSIGPYSNITIDSYKSIIDSKSISENIDKAIVNINSIPPNAFVDVRIIVDYIVENPDKYDYKKYYESVEKLFSEIKCKNYLIGWHSKYRETPCSKFSYYAIDSDGNRKKCHRLFGSASETVDFKYFSEESIKYIEDKCVYAIDIPENIANIQNDESKKIINMIGRNRRVQDGVSALGSGGMCDGCT